MMARKRFVETAMTRYLNAPGPVAGYRPPYSGRCANCSAITMVLESLSGGEGMLICPNCSNRPDLTQLIARLPSRQWILHATDCTVCHFPQTICEAGALALAQRQAA